MREIKHHSLYEFLEDNLKGIKNPNNDLIIELKKKYWKEYFYFYRKNYRQKFQEVTLRFSNKNLSLIHI